MQLFTQSRSFGDLFPLAANLSFQIEALRATVGRVAQHGRGDYVLLLQIHRYPGRAGGRFGGPQGSRIAVRDMRLVQFIFTTGPCTGNVHGFVLRQIKRQLRHLC